MPEGGGSGANRGSGGGGIGSIELEVETADKWTEFLLGILLFLLQMIVCSSIESLESV